MSGRREDRLRRRSRASRLARIAPVLCVTLALASCGPLSEEVRSPRPNILLIVADDLGYTDLGVYGGEIGTPNIDALATEGVLFTRFHTASTCSPTRAMLWTGLDSHLVGLGAMAQEQTANQKTIPGYEGYLNFRAPTLPELLREAGYHTSLSGKWHLGVDATTSPSARGFERTFALMNGGSGHFDAMPMFPGPPALYQQDGVEVDLPDDFYSTRDFADRTIAFIDESLEEGRPFFAHLAFTAPHWPLQAPDASIAKYAGRYDDGYEALRARRIARQRELGLLPESAEAWPGLDGVPSWDELTPEERAIESRKMEIYAAMVHDLDREVGRVLDHLREAGVIDETLVVFMSDNGAEGHDIQATWPEVRDYVADCCDNSLANMGRRDSYVDYGPGWASASVGASRLYKGFSTEGALLAPAIVSFPGRFQGERRYGGFVSVLDLMPTLLELAGVEHPRSEEGELLRLQGRSMLAMLDGDAESVHGDEPVMGWELFGRRAVRRGDVKLTYTTEPHGKGKWELFDLATDPAELRDLSGERPELFEEMLALWDDYVTENGIVLPDAPSAY